MMVGKSLSHYKILEELGRGGMGIVYKARDTKLDRDVAIKILPSAALASKEDRERFYREAKSAAQLHHPNIASVFEIDEAVPEGGDAAEPRPFIAMEYISGETLHELISKGPMKLADAVNVSVQVAEALKAAHAKNIVHRDIKSANVMITEEGVAKVLDFGLAKTNQSTLLTRMGSTLGTVAYMSPEQARGQEVDGRTDLYSLGTMLYEMVAGRLPFAGEYEQAVVYSILNESPEPLTSVRTGVPMQLEWIVNKLLAKDAEYRYQSSAGLLADLKSLDLSGSGMSRRSMPAVGVTSKSSAYIGAAGSRPGWFWPTMVVAAVLVSALATWMAASSADIEPSFDVPAAFTLAESGGNATYLTRSVSPSGRYILFSKTQGNDQVSVLRDLVSGQEEVVLHDLADGYDFSTNEEWLLLSSRAGVMSRVRVQDGGAVNVPVVGDAPLFVGSTEFVFVRDGSLWMADLDGDEESLVISPDSAQHHDNIQATQWLEEEQLIVLTASRDSGEWDIALGDLKSGTYTVIEEQARDGFYVDSGHLIYLKMGDDRSDRVLLARPFELSKQTFTGPSVDLMPGQFWPRGFSATRQGVMVWTTRVLSGNAETLYRIMPGNEPVPIGAPAGRYYSPDISPDQTTMAVRLRSNDGSKSDIYLVNLESANMTRLSYTENAFDPVFSADGELVYFSGLILGSEFLMQRPTNGSRPESLFSLADQDSIKGSNLHQSVDGDLFNWIERSENSKVVRIASQTDPERRQLIELDGDEAASSDGVESGPFSPDGKYVSVIIQSGSYGEVRVQEVFGDAFWTVDSADQVFYGSIKWSADGKWLYFAKDNAIWRASVQTDPVFQSREAEQVTPDTYQSRSFALYPDGERLIAVIRGLNLRSEESDEERQTSYIRVNLDAWLKEIAPPRD